MDFQAHTMAYRVREVLLQPRLPQYHASSFVWSANRCASLHSERCGALGLLQHGQDYLLFRRGRRRKKDAALVRAITAETRTYVNLNNMATLQFSIRWMMVRTTRVLPKRHDRFKRQPIGS